METNKENPRSFERTHYSIDVCDTEYCSDKQKFSIFRDAVAKRGMPWRFEISPDTEFDARITSIEFQKGLVSRIKMTPLVGTRSDTEIANSAIDGFYVCYLISGEARVEQDSRDVVGTNRSLMVFDGSSPVRVTERAKGAYDVISLVVPRTHFEDVKDVNSLFCNISISSEQLSNPLAACLTTLCNILPTASADELIALYEASIILLPMSVGRRKAELTEKMELLPNRHARELLKFVNDNIGSANLSPRSAANYLGMSVSYVHRQFAINGTTFGAYLMAKRLEGVRRDLISEACDGIPIFALAFRWGFNDLSTFIRAFKKKFGCTPRQCRRSG